MNYEQIYTRGYLVSKKATSASVVAKWASIELGGYFFYFDEKTEIYTWTKANKSIVLIGCASDPEEVSETTQTIAKKISQIFEEKGSIAAIKYIAYLGGRFLSFLVEHYVELQVIPDCHATYACYYSCADEPLFASHINLLAELGHNDVDEVARGVVVSQDYVSPGGKYYPALMLPYKECSNIFPNNKLVNLYNSRVVECERFYPFDDTKIVESPLTENLVNQFNQLLGANIRAIVKDRNFHISLTGGNDSGVTLAAVIREQLSSQTKSFTYFNVTSAVGMSDDLFLASNRAYKANIPHKVVELNPLDLSSKFHAMYSKSFRLGARFPSLAKAYYENLPHDILSLVSTCSETGTVFYKDRSENEITPSTLASQFSKSKIKENPDVLMSFEKYIEQTSFSKKRLAGLDFYDVFYWEHRNAKWGSLWYSEADLSHFTVVPFNQRTLIELMLSIPLEQRADKELLKRSMSD